MFGSGKKSVVLCVGNLDRRDPNNVLDVLEALRLRVKIEPFVAVVAIDPRNVCPSLEKRKHINIIQSNRSPTGMDFLEKTMCLVEMRCLSRTSEPFIFDEACAIPGTLVLLMDFDVTVVVWKASSSWFMN